MICGVQNADRSTVSSDASVAQMVECGPGKPKDGGSNPPGSIDFSSGLTMGSLYINMYIYMYTKRKEKTKKEDFLLKMIMKFSLRLWRRTLLIGKKLRVYKHEAYNRQDWMNHPVEVLSYIP